MDRRGPLAATAVFLAWMPSISCREPASPEKELVPFQPVGDLRCWSADDSTVGLQWNHSPSVLSFDALEYAVEVREGDSLITTRGTPLNVTRVVVSPLRDGTLYRFDVFLRAIDDPADFYSGPAVSRIWSPASRFVHLAGTSSPIRVPARTDTSAIGLQLFDPLAGGPLLRDGATAEGLAVDVFFDPVIPAVRTGEDLGPPFPGTATRFSTMQPIVAATADEPLDFPPAADGFTLKQVELPIGSVGGGLILFGKSGSGHVFRLFLRPDPSGPLIRGSSPDQYIEVEISHQVSTSIDIASAHEN